MLQDSKKSNARRLTAMEKKQGETNRRLDDVMESNLNLQKSNLNLQNMLMSVLSNLTGKDGFQGARTEGALQSDPAGTSGQLARTNSNRDGESGGSGSSEMWWDKLCKTSEDEEEKYDDNGNRVLGRFESNIQVIICTRMFNLKNSIFIMSSSGFSNCVFVIRYCI